MLSISGKADSEGRTVESGDDDWPPLDAFSLATLPLEGALALGGEISSFVASRWKESEAGRDESGEEDSSGNAAPSSRAWR